MKKIEQSLNAISNKTQQLGDFKDNIWNYKYPDLEIQQLREQWKFLLGTKAFTGTELQDLENYLKILIILVTTTQNLFHHQINKIKYQILLAVITHYNAYWAK